MKDLSSYLHDQRLRFLYNWKFEAKWQFRGRDLHSSFQFFKTLFAICRTIGNFCICGKKRK